MSIEPVLLEEFGGLEIRRQILVRRFLDHARPGEADHRFRLREIDVADRGEARADAAGGRMREHGEVGQPRLRVQRERAAGFRHLHAAESTPSYIRAPPEAETMITGSRSLRAALDEAGELFADDRAHGGGDEIEIHDRDRDAAGRRSCRGR